MPERHNRTAVEPLCVPNRFSCFSLEVHGHFYAVMMTAVMHTPMPKKDPLTADLVCVMNYRASSPPTDLHVFEKRLWMHLHFGQWGGKQLMMWCARDLDFERSRLVFLGDVASRSDDPRDSPKVGFWPGLLAVLERVSTLTATDSRS